MDKIEHVNTTFLDYLAKMQHIQESATSKIQLDGIMLVMYAQMTGLNIVVIHGEGVWATDEHTKYNVILVYKGSGEFLPTKQCNNK